MDLGDHLAAAVPVEAVGHDPLVTGERADLRDQGLEQCAQGLDAVQPLQRVAQGQQSRVAWQQEVGERGVLPFQDQQALDPVAEQVQGTRPVRPVGERQEVRQDPEQVDRREPRPQLIDGRGRQQALQRLAGQGPLGQSEKGAGIRARLHHPQLRLGEDQQGPVRLDGPGQVHRLAVAGPEVQDERLGLRCGGAGRCGRSD